jgi:hypothetical protein
MVKYRNKKGDIVLKPVYRNEYGKIITEKEYYKKPPNEPEGISDLKIEPTPKREKTKEVVFKNSGDKEPTVVKGLTLEEYYDHKRPDKKESPMEDSLLWKYEKGEFVEKKK